MRVTLNMSHKVDTKRPFLNHLLHAVAVLRFHAQSIIILSETTRNRTMGDDRHRRCGRQGEREDDALRQILDNRYYEGLRGEVLCMGVVHDKKRCALAHETITNK